MAKVVRPWSRGRLAECLAFFVLTCAVAFLWLASGGVMEVEGDDGNARLDVALVLAVVLAVVALSGYATARADAVLLVLTAPLPVLAIWQAVFLLSDGTVWWEPDADGSAAFLYVYVMPLVVVTAVGVLAGRLRRRLLAPTLP